MRRKKRVYFVSPDMTGGGAEKVIILLLNHLDKSRFVLKLILFNKVGVNLEDIPADIEIVDLKKRNRWDLFRLIFGLRKLIKEQEPDILFSFLHYGNIIAVLSGLFLRTQCKIIIGEQNYHRRYLPHTRFKVLRGILIAFTYKRAYKITACSNEIKRALISDFSIDKDRISVIYNPVDIGEIEKLSRKIISHPFFENKEDKFVIVTAARLTIQKNQSLLIEAFASVRKEIPAFLVILGEGELKTDLQTLVKNLGVEKYVDFVGYQKNMYSWTKRADLFVLSSNWEGFGNVIVEAMVCGVTVISTDCSAGPGEIITDRKNGLLVPVNDVRSMYKAILEVANNKELSNRLKEEAFRDVERFDFSNIVPKYENIFEYV